MSEMKISTRQAWRGPGHYFDSASPAFYVKDHATHGKALACDYPSLPGEGAEAYWRRVAALTSPFVLRA